MNQALEVCSGLWRVASPEGGQLSVGLSSNRKSAGEKFGLAGWTETLHRPCAVLESALTPVSLVLFCSVRGRWLWTRELGSNLDLRALTTSWLEWKQWRIFSLMSHSRCFCRKEEWSELNTWLIITGLLQTGHSTPRKEDTCVSVSVNGTSGSLHSFWLPATESRLPRTKEV